MLTGQRVNEVAGITWSEIAGDLKTWKIPRTRTKNGEPHIVPLSEPARDLLRALLPSDAQDIAQIIQHLGDTLVLSGARGTAFSGFSKAKTALDEASGVSDRVLRRSAPDARDRDAAAWRAARSDRSDPQPCERKPRRDRWRLPKARLGRGEAGCSGSMGGTSQACIEGLDAPRNIVSWRCACENLALAEKRDIIPAKTKPMEPAVTPLFSQWSIPRSPKSTGS